MEEGQKRQKLLIKFARLHGTNECLVLAAGWLRFDLDGRKVGWRVGWPGAREGLAMRYTGVGMRYRNG